MGKYMKIDLAEIIQEFQGLQNRITAGLEKSDGQAIFKSDIWKREAGGGGDTRVIENGRIFEKGGVNFSHVHGPLPEKIALRLKLPVHENFHATGVSLVIHPSHPFIPVIHMNVRYFEISDGTWWFGGGIDLTPAYIDTEDVQLFHTHMEAVCKPFGASVYPIFKKNCDTYFYLKHRNETRGIGGLFFDFQKPGDLFADADTLWSFVRAVGNSFLPVYQELILKNQDRFYTEQQRDFQLWRRGRYVEFNLLYDKGTSFGLDTGGRTESILMSLPPLVKWIYDFTPQPGSPEEKTIEWLRGEGRG